MRELTHAGLRTGSISQTLTYPFDVLRRKMQVTGMDALGVKYSGALDALQRILKTEGPRGLYRGLWPNLRTSLISGFWVKLLTSCIYALWAVQSRSRQA